MVSSHINNLVSQSVSQSVCQLQSLALTALFIIFPPKNLAVLSHRCTARFRLCIYNFRKWRIKWIHYDCILYYCNVFISTCWVRVTRSFSSLIMIFWWLEFFLIVLHKQIIVHWRFYLEKEGKTWGQCHISEVIKIKFETSLFSLSAWKISW